MNFRNIEALIGVVSVLCACLLGGCIKNDLPYPRIQQNILALSVENETKSAYIDSMTQQATVYLDEQTDIQNVKFTEFKITDGATSNVDLLSGTHNLSQPLYLTISKYQEYFWEIRAVQEIERYFQVEGEMGESVVDAVAKRVVVTMPEGNDLSDLTLLSAKLGPSGITTYNPELTPGKLDLSYPLRVEVTAWGRTEIWTIYVEVSEAIVTTSQVDAWSKVIWAYGIGKSGADSGFQYRQVGSPTWLDVPAEDVIHEGGNFSCCISHLIPETDYEVRTKSDNSFGNIVKVKTQSTVDIINGSFDNWYQGGDSGLQWNPWPLDGTQYWDTGNTGSMTMKKNVTVPSDDTPTGRGKSAKLESQFVGLGTVGKFAAGSIYTGKYARTDGFDGVLDFGKPWSGLRPTRLKGYYKYKSVPIDYANNEYQSLKGRPDTCSIYVALTDWTAPFEVRTKVSNRKLFDPNSPSVIGYGELTSGNSTNGFEYFDIKINYRDTHKLPSYVLICASASKYGDYFTGGSGSILWVDEFSFDWDY